MCDWPVDMDLDIAIALMSSGNDEGEANTNTRTSLCGSSSCPSQYRLPLRLSFGKTPTPRACSRLRVNWRIKEARTRSSATGTCKHPFRTPRSLHVHTQNSPVHFIHLFCFRNGGSYQADRHKYLHWQRLPRAPPRWSLSSRPHTRG